MSSNPCRPRFLSRAAILASASRSSRFPGLFLALLLALLLGGLPGCLAVQRNGASASAEVAAAPAARPAVDGVAAAKARVAAYHESGQYRREVEAVARQVQDWLEKALARKPELRPAVVFSLDDVLLSNYARRKALDFAEPAVLSANLGLPPALLSPPLPALAPLLPVFAYARDHGAAVFVVSERPEIERASIQDNLTRAGYEGWTAILLPPPGEEKQPLAGVKARLREIIESRGCAIVANVGSKEEDLAGGRAEKGFLLPDPRY